MIQITVQIGTPCDPEAGATAAFVALALAYTPTAALSSDVAFAITSGGVLFPPSSGGPPATGAESTVGVGVRFGEVVIGGVVAMGGVTSTGGPMIGGATTGGATGVTGCSN
jgi:hypothetical protein